MRRFDQKTGWATPIEPAEAEAPGEPPSEAGAQGRSGEDSAIEAGGDQPSVGGASK